MTQKSPRVHDDITLQQLEFPHIIDKLRSLLSTYYGHGKLDEASFETELEKVTASLQEVGELKALLDAGYPPPLGGMENILNHLNTIQPQDAFLEAKSLLQVCAVLQQLSDVKKYFRQHRDAVPALKQYTEAIHPHNQIVQEVQRTIDPTGEISDNASPELRTIRTSIRARQSEQKNTLRRIQKRYAEYSQDELVTLRDGRLVLGIQPSHVNKVSGVVHGTSGSGHTVFIEPMETLRVGNEIQSLRIEERNEIIKILRFLTGLIREVRYDIMYGLDNVGMLDLLLAKAKLAVELHAVAPHLTTDVSLKLADARHPLLLLKSGDEHVVPLSVELGESIKTLVITGPNAGGKTVAMKTAGLMILMTQFGLLIPVQPDSKIPVQVRVLVDIGDRQSLEQDLSTFSAHIVRLKSIIERATRQSFVLLDEVGTGTDPQEGAALAVSILKSLTEKGAITIATTHHGELKAFAHEADQIENGSMEFDLESLKPTYNLRMGVPGSSYAFEIAQRYGLPVHIIDQARESAGSDKNKLEALILDMESRLQKYEKQSAELSIKLSQAAAAEKLYENQVADLKKNKKQLKAEARAEAREIVKDANALIERTIKEIRESGGDKQSIREARRQFQDEKDKLKQEAEQSEAVTAADSAGLSKGSTVWVGSLQQNGQLLENAPDKGKVRVSVGNVTMTLDVSGLHPVAEPEAAKTKAKPAPISDTAIDQSTITPELDLRGMDGESGIAETDRYLDLALESDWTEVRIVHGKGTGVLRQKINQFLSKDKRVATKRLGRYGEGDTGVTVITLRK